MDQQIVATKTSSFITIEETGSQRHTWLKVVTKTSSLITSEITRKEKN